MLNNYQKLVVSFLLYHRVWSSIVIEHEKSVFLLLFFRNISKTAETVLIKKIGRSYDISVYKKAQISEHRKNDIFWTITVFSKCLLVSLCVTKFLWTS